jgi:2-phospho-L-lactate guanylyltransferase
MRTVAVVPINRLALAKTRLSRALSAAERRALVEWMAGRTLRALAGSSRIAGIAVVSPDPAARALARAQGAAAIVQRIGGLNDGLELGRQWALQRGADALLVVLADLPRLTSAEVDAMLALGDGPSGTARVVLAPDQRGHGTNALLLRPPAVIPFSFGAESLGRHRALARYVAVDPLYFRSSGTAGDVDTPDDLRALIRAGLWTPESARPPYGAPASEASA